MPAATNRMGIAFVKETVFGTTPSGPPTLTDVRFTSESLKQDTSTTTSTEIRSDRQIPSVPRTTVGASGDIAWEMYAGGSLETLTAATMQAAEAAVAETAQASLTVTVTAASKLFTVTAGTWSASDATAGDWVKTEGFAAAGNNGYFRVTASNAGGFTVDNADGLVDVTADTGVTVTTGAYYANGTSQRSYTVEKSYADESIFEVTTGATFEGMSLSVPTDGIITGSFSTIGKQAVSGAATVGDGSNGTAGTAAAMSGVDHVSAVFIGGETITTTGLDFSLVNNLRNRQEIGSAFTTSVGAGSLGITGSVQAYFGAGDPVTVMDLYTAGTDTDIAVLFDDGTNQVLIDFPRVRLTSGQRVAGGQNQDVVMEIGFEAFKHASTDTTMRYVKW